MRVGASASEALELLRKRAAGFYQSYPENLSLAAREPPLFVAVAASSLRFCLSSSKGQQEGRGPAAGFPVGGRRRGQGAFGFLFLDFFLLLLRPPLRRSSSSRKWRRSWSRLSGGLRLFSSRWRLRSREGVIWRGAGKELGLVKKNEKKKKTKKSREAESSDFLKEKQGRRQSLSYSAW